MFFTLSYSYSGKLLSMTKNCRDNVETLVRYMSKQDERLAYLEESQRAMQAHFVREAATCNRSFPIKTVPDLLEYAEQGNFNNLISV